MGMSNIIKSFTDGTIKENKLLARDGVINLSAVLGGRNIGNLRVFVAASPGLGHQATTINIVRRLISLGFDKNNKIEVYYEDDKQYPNLDKFKVLVPGFRPSSPGDTYKLDGVDITFSPFKKGKMVLPDGYFGVTGGYDDNDVGTKAINFATELNVELFLQLQPFQWELGWNCLWKKSDQTPTILSNVDLLGQNSFINRAYYMPKPNVSDQEWDDFFDTLGYPDSLHIAELLFETLSAPVPKPDINFVPVYGISDQYSIPDTLNHLAGCPSTILFGLTSAVAFAQEHSKEKVKKPTVIGLMTTLTKDAWTNYQNLIFGNSKYQYAQKWAQNHNLSKRVQVMTQPNSDEFVKRLNALLPKEILVVAIPNLPPDIFNLLYSVATFPFVFEGKGTANLALNLGNPYLQLAKQSVCVYPSYFLLEYGQHFNSSMAQHLSKISYLLQEWIGGWSAQEKETPATEVGYFYEESLANPCAVYLSYFKHIYDFYHTEQNDKLLMALLYAMPQSSLWPKSQLTQNGMASPELMVQAAAPSPLEQLYKKLIANVESNILNLFPGAISSGTLFDYLIDIIGGPKLSIGSDKTAVSIDFSEPYDKIRVTGPTTDFAGEDISMELVFSLDQNNNGIVTNLTLGGYSFSFDNALWFKVDNPKITATVQERGSRISGSIAGVFAIADKSLNVSFLMPQAENQLLLSGTFDESPPSIDSIFQLLGGINFLQTFPAPLNQAGSIALKGLKIAYDYKKLEVCNLNVTVQTVKDWELFGKVKLEKGSNIQVIVGPPTGNRSIGWIMQGFLAIGDGTIELGATYPDLSLTAQLASDSAPISLSDFLTFFLPEGVSVPVSGNIQDFAMYVTPGSPTSYFVRTGIGTDWPITISGSTIFTLKSLQFQVQGTGSEATGSIAATTIILPDSAKIDLSVSAAYRGSTAGWTFTGKQTSGQVSLIELLTAYLPAEWKQDPTQFDVLVDGLGLTIETATNSWEFTGKTATPISIPGTGIEVSLNLKMGYNGGTGSMGGRDTIIGLAEVPILASNGRLIPLMLLSAEAEPEIGYFGTLSAEVIWENIDITVFYDFKPGYKSFGIKWGIFEGKLISNGETKATLHFTESTTIGSMVETMVSWATGSSFSLGSPWNILDSIPLSNLSLEYNFTKKQVHFNVDIGPIEMGFARIDGFKLSYNSNQTKNEDNGVMVEITGQFRWQDDPGKPLGWDASKPENTPAPEGQGNKYLDLRMLALGQHVTLPCFAGADTVQEAIACMKQLPEPDKDNIMIPPVTLDTNSSWLIGMDFGVLRFGGDKEQKDVEGAALISMAPSEAASSGYLITMQIVFNDPNLYALRIKLDGDAAKVLKGLDFQIMYKKISDSIGVYKAEITLPDQMRYIRMGTCNITLPVFGIEYYTNGDFQVDFGFPWNADFSRSLTFQTWIMTPVGVPIPVMGSLGVYFGKLSGATTDKVPKITNGTFNPVLVFGFGIQFGIGYTFDAGILKAGFSLTAVSILEGVVAKFNPYQITDGSGDKNQIDSSYYFSLKGTVGVIGKLFGTVDFAIIKADVNVDIRILTSLTFAPYEPIELNLTASVSVSLSVKIKLGFFKISIHFSFSMKISQTLTINAIGGNPPWQIDKEATAFLFLRRRKRKRDLPGPFMLRALAESAAPEWNNLKATTAPQRLQGYMVFGLTMASDTATTVSEQIACYTAMMFIDSVAPPQKDRASSTDKAYGNTSDTSFELLAKMILRWAVAAIQPAPVTADEVDNIVIKDFELEALLNTLNKPDTPTPISGADIETFMAGQFDFRVEGPTTTSKKKEPDATYFPVAPAMTLDLPKYGGHYQSLHYTFGEYNKTSSDYLKFLRDYFNELAVKVEEETKTALKAFALEDSNGDSLAGFIFSDYFLMICRQMLQSALDSLREFKYYLKDGQTPDDIVNWINDNADLSGSVAYNLEELFTGNADAGLNPGKQLLIQGATYIVQANDTFDTIAGNELFGSDLTGEKLAKTNAETDNTLTAGVKITYPGKDAYTTQPGQSLKKVADEIGVGIDDLINNAGITSLPNLPLPVATFKVPEFTYKTVAEDNLRGVAAKFRIDQARLADAAPNGKVADLFDKSANPALDIANLTQFKVGELIKEIQATQGLQHLSGMTSRYYLAGLRLPTYGITPEKKGMWVTGEKPGEYKLPEFAGLYALTGQQFAIPDLTDKDDFNVNFENGGLKWLNFENSDPTKLQISIKPNTDDTKQINLVKNYATANKLDTGLTFLGLRGMFETKEATYTFNSEIQWNAASAFPMPYGGMPPGVPDMRLWLMPDTLLALPDLSTRKVNPRVAMKVGEYNEAAGALVNHDLNCYGYASLIEFTVKKVPVKDASPSTKTTYEVMGADGSSANVLERIVSEIGSNNNAIRTLILAYPSDPNGTTSNGIQTDSADALTLGLAQVNLSTETRPDSGFAFDSLLAAGGGDGMTLLNEKTDFIRLLWEAGITRAGGYFLYYFNMDNKGGLPDRVFNDKNEAVLSLIVIYSQPTDTQIKNTITGYTNVLVTGESIDKNSTLFAEADPSKDVTVPSLASQTLAGLAYDYFGNVSQVASDNAGLNLRAGLNIVVSEGTYEVGPNAPGGGLQNIADYFGTSVQAIRDANPMRTSWPDPLDLYTVLYLPTLTIEVGKNKGGDTLGGLADYYGMNLTALANHNKNVAGIFADGKSVKISGGPVITTSTVPPGNVTIEATRPKPPEIPETLAGDDYGKIFLLNMYSLLSYQVSDNLYFRSSKPGLPAGPTAEPENGKNVSKIRVPKAIAEGGDWLFRMAAPYNGFSKQTPNGMAECPDPKDSPYRGLGDLLQIDFAWQDIFGNRLITNLSNPVAGDNAPLNKPPIITGYNDPIIGLKQWPSVASTYEVVVDKTGKPMINLILTFDDSVYQGLMSAKVTNTISIDAIFTEDLDKSSAETIGNYMLDNDITIVAAALNEKTVTLTVDKIPEEVEITLNVANIEAKIKTTNKPLTFQGSAKFYNPATAGEPSSILIQKAKGDLQTYTRLWYQLHDSYGIGFSVETSLLTEDFMLDSGPVKGWLTSIWKFVNDRAKGGMGISVPDASHQLSLMIDKSKLNPAEIYKLDLNFTIKRTGGTVMGDLETTSGIKSVTTAISPYAGVAGETATDLSDFAKHFEQALASAGVYELRVASGVDREENLTSTGNNELWVVRLGLANNTSISYRINNPDAPQLFAPRPVSNKLMNRDKVSIWDFDPKTGINFNGDPTRHLDFTGIDMDLWARQFFSDVDNVLSAEFTAAIQLVDYKKNTTSLQTMLDNKKALAGIIKDWLTFVFEDESGSTAEIQEAFRQQLLVRLGNAYTVKAGVQYNAKVAAQSEAVTPPALYGNITQNFKFLGAAINKDMSKIHLYFSATLDKTSAENVGNYTVSDLTVNSATLSDDSSEVVTLRLSGNAIVDTTKVTIITFFTDINGRKIQGALKQTVKTNVDISHRTGGISITAAKLNLKSSDSAPLPFLVSAPQLVRGDSGDVLPYIDLDTSYQGSAIEHQISTLPNISDYRASSWLNFFNKTSELDADLGVAKVPMILRSFPSSPSMVNQEGKASNPISGSQISKILEWNYTINYSQTIHYPQDELDFTVNFNVYDDNVLTAFRDAFNDLAEFVTVYPDVEKVFFETLINIDATTTDPSKFEDAATALKAFNDMVGRIVKSAEGNGMRMAESKPSRLSAAVEPYVFQLKEGSGTVGTEKSALLVTIIGKPPAGIGDPTLQISGYTTKPYSGTCNGDYCFYFEDGDKKKPLTAEAGQKIGPRTVVLPDMNILARQDADTTVELKRNVDLVPGKTTVSDFIYSTGKVGFVNPYHPLIEHGEDIDIAKIGGGVSHKATLKQHLTNLFTELLKENSQDTLSFLMTNTYTYQANPTLDEIELPVIMQPMQNFDVKELPAGNGDKTRTLTEMIDSWSGSILDWFNKYHHTSTQGGILHFDFTIFSNLTKRPKPLLRLNSLKLDLEYVTDLPEVKTV